MATEKILVIGACGQIGTELVAALRAQYGAAQVIAADIRSETGALKGLGPFVQMDVMDRETLQVQARRHKITQVYLLSAMLSATGEAQPHRAWGLNMQGLLNTLETAREEKMQKVFWPSSIAVFGPSAPKERCPQHAAQDPATVYGISKMAGERWCSYYHDRWGLDVRSLRYPGLISLDAPPGGGTTDYAVDMLLHATKRQAYECYLNKDAMLPMMFMPDAIKATQQLMDATCQDIRIRGSYNIAAMSFSPEQLAAEIRQYVPGFTESYRPDERQMIAGSWPWSIDDSEARQEWGWKPGFNMSRMTKHIMEKLILFPAALS